MLKKLAQLWNSLFAPRGWDTYGDAKTGTFRARRWVDGAWEYRAASAEEAREAIYWQANK